LNKEKIGDLIQIVGIFAVFASLMFVGYEIRQSGLVAKEESLLSETAIVTSMQALVIDNAEVWLRGCMGEELEPAEQMVFTRLYHTLIFRRYFSWLRATQAISVGSDSLGITHMAANLYRNAGLRREWQLHGEWRAYVPDEAAFQIWRRLVEDRLKEMPMIEPAPTVNPYRCGLN